MIEQKILPFDQISSISKISLIGLPVLPGVSELTKNEIRKDIRDIERFILAYDSDSDSSIKSEDVLPSSYPVKPRKTPRMPNRYVNSDRSKENTEFDENKTNIAVAIESLEYFKSVKANKSELYQAEVEREKLDILYNSFSNAIKEKTLKLTKTKKAQENYIQILQAIYGKLITQTTLYNKQNTMLFDIYMAMQRRKETIESIEKNTKQLKNSISNKQKNNNIYLLNINNNEIVIHLEQYIKTPMGIGQIEYINGNSYIITIRLPYGKMYSNLYNILKWIDFDVSTDKSLINKWKSSKTINKSMEYKTSIRNLFGHVNDDIITDYDDDLSQIDESILVDHNEMVIDNNNNHSDENQLNDKPTNYFPLNNNVINNQRHNIKKSLHNDVLFDPINKIDLPLAFAPPRCLPSLINTYKNNDKINICESALSTPEYVKLGSTGYLTWNGNSDAMESTLKQSNAEVSKLSNELVLLMNDARFNTLKRLKLMQETSIRRLNMFTRRVRHRNNLNNHGITVTSHLMNLSTISQKLSAIPNINIRPNEYEDCSNDRNKDDSIDNKITVKNELFIKDENKFNTSPVKEMLSQSDISVNAATQPLKKKPISSTNGRRGSGKNNSNDRISSPNEILDTAALASLSSSILIPTLPKSKGSSKSVDKIANEISASPLLKTSGINEDEVIHGNVNTSAKKRNNTNINNVNKRIRKN